MRMIIKSCLTWSLDWSMMQAKCVDFILAILYIVLVSLFLGGGLLHRIKGKKKSSQMRPMPEAVNSQKPDTIHAQVPVLSLAAL